MNIAINPKGGFFRVRAGRLVGQRYQPDIAAFVTLTNRTELAQLRVLFGPLLQEMGNRLVAIVSVKTDLVQCYLLKKIARARARARVLFKSYL